METKLDINSAFLTKLSEVPKFDDSLKAASGILLGLALSVPLWGLIIWGFVSLFSH